MPHIPRNLPAVPELTWRAAMGQVATGIKARASVALAKFAGYHAANRTPTTRQGTFIGTNPNSTYASIQRVAMYWTSEDIAKNSAIGAAYLKTRQNYCSSELNYIPDTGDPMLDKELKAALEERWKTGGINCSFYDAFSRTADVELPVRGDSVLVYYRDVNQLKVMEASADQIGELYEFTSPSIRDGLKYFAGIFYNPRNNERIGFNIKDRVNNWYGAPKYYPASDVIYFQDNMFRGMRGITIFANALQHMDRADQLFTLGIEAAMRQSRDAFAVFNESGGPQLDEYNYETVTDQDGKVRAVNQVPNGPQVSYYFNGDEIESVPRDSPGEELIKGVEKSDEMVALALGFTYAFLISGQYVGGAPSRFDTRRAGREITRIENRVHRPRLDYHSFIEIMDMVDRKQFPPRPGITNGQWHFGDQPTADAYRETQDDIKSTRAGQDSNTRVLARNGTTHEQIMADKKKETVAAYKTLWEVNQELQAEGVPYEANIADIQQNSDNPQQSATAQAIDTGKDAQVTPGAQKATASMSAYIGDVPVNELPASTQEAITKTLGRDASGLRVAKYGMTPRELLNKADQHNYDAATGRIRNVPNYVARADVMSDKDKHILLMNDRIADGHHYLAKAIKGRVTNALPVIDLTPTRFQTS